MFLWYVQTTESTSARDKLLSTSIFFPKPKSVFRITSIDYRTNLHHFLVFQLPDVLTYYVFLLLTHILSLPHLIKIVFSSNLSILTTDRCFHLVNLSPEFNSYPFTTWKPSLLLTTKCFYRDPFLPFIIFFISVLLNFSMLS